MSKPTISDEARIAIVSIYPILLLCPADTVLRPFVLSNTNLEDKPSHVGINVFGRSH